MGQKVHGMLQRKDGINLASKRRMENVSKSSEVPRQDGRKDPIRKMEKRKENNRVKVQTVKDNSEVLVNPTAMQRMAGNTGLQFRGMVRHQ